jgi:uncharacterized BrkB/YihY/UPF0761 family membrane protein
LLLVVTVIGLVLANDDGLRQRVLNSALSEFPIIGGQLGNNIHALKRSSTPALVVALFGLHSGVLTPKVVETRRLWPGAASGGLAWTTLQAVGGYLVQRQLRGSSQVYGTFAVVLGLLAWVYVGIRLTVYAAELNTVLHRHLWPRTIVQPPLTRADRVSIALQAHHNLRRPEQEVSVSFTDEAHQNQD